MNCREPTSLWDTAVAKLMQAMACKLLKNLALLSVSLSFQVVVIMTPVLLMLSLVNKMDTTQSLWWVRTAVQGTCEASWICFPLIFTSVEEITKASQ